MSAQVASFLGELEASGLLTDTDQLPSSSNAGGKMPPDTSMGTALAGAVTAAVQPVAPAGQPDASAAPALEQASEHDRPPESDTARAAPSEEASQPAEQRVLGKLEGTADQQWFEVMDMASRKVYFWNASSNDVLWSPPSGAQPRSTEEAAAAAAAAAIPSEEHHAPAAVAPDSASDSAAHADETGQPHVGPISTADVSNTELSSSSQAVEPHTDQIAAFSAHQLQLLTLLLQQEAASHHLQEPHVLQQLCIQAAALHTAYTAVLGMSSETSADHLVLPKTAFNAWAQQQSDALQAQAEEAIQAGSSAPDSTLQLVHPVLHRDNAHAAAQPQPQTDSDGLRSISEIQPDDSAGPEDGELTSESSQEAADDMDIEHPSEAQPALPGASEAARQTHLPPLPEDSTAAGSDGEAPPLPEGPSSSQQSAGAAAAEHLAASFMPEAAHAEAAVPLRDRRKEYSAQPVRSATPPTAYPAGTSYSTEDATYHPEAQVMLCWPATLSTAFLMPTCGCIKIAGFNTCMLLDCEAGSATVLTCASQACKPVQQVHLCNCSIPIQHRLSLRAC